jgi:tetratricopeptide (TPR) repeat protein
MSSQERPPGVSAATAGAHSEEPRRRAARWPVARWRAARWLLPAVFALALAFRLAFVYEIRDLPTLHQLVMDAQRYDALARDILDHGWRPREPFYQAPLYPYLLAAVYAVAGRSPAAVRLLQALAGALTAVLAAVAAGRLCRRTGTAAAAVAGALAALYAPAVFYTPLLLKTVPVLLLESAALVLLLPPGGRRLTAARALAAGCALGGAALLQESLLVLAPAAALYVLVASRQGEPAQILAASEERPGRAASEDRVPTRELAGGGEPAPKGPGPEQEVRGERWRERRWWRGQRRKIGHGRALNLLLGTVLALAPAALLNYGAGGQLLLTSSQGGMNFYIGNARGATGTYAALSSGSQVPEQQRADARRLAAAFASRERGREVAPGALTPAEISRIFWREAGRQIAADPGAWLRLLLRKLRLFWNAYELPDAEGFRVYRRESILLRFDPVVFGMVTPLAAVGLAALVRDGRRREATLLALLAAATCTAVVTFFVFGRYRLAVVPFLLPLAAAGVLELVETCTSARATTWRAAARPALALALLAAAGLAVNLPCYSAAEVRQQDAVIEYNLGTAAARWSEDSYAGFQRLAAGGGPGSPAARRRLAAAVEEASRAAAYLEAAALASPGFLAAELEWAIARARRGSYLEAAGEYAQAAADLGAARQRLAAALAAAGAANVAPELDREAWRTLAALGAGTAAALNNLGVQRIGAGDLDGAEQVLAQAAAMAPDLPGPRGSLALCWFQRGIAARRRGAEADAARLFQLSRDAYRRAVGLAESAGRGDLVALYRRGLAAVDGETVR